MLLTEAPGQTLVTTGPRAKTKEDNMKRQANFLCLLVILLITIGCGGYIPGNYGAQAQSDNTSTTNPINRMVLKGELMAPDSTVVQLVEYRGKRSATPWWSAEQVVEQLHQDSGGMPKETIRAIWSEDPTKAFLVYMDQKSEVSYRMGIYLPENIYLQFKVRGSLLLTIQTDDGQVVEVLDSGIVFPRQSRQITRWDDTANGGVRIFSGFTEDLPKDYPVMAFVQVPKKYQGCEVLEITATNWLSVSCQTAVSSR